MEPSSTEEPRASKPRRILPATLGTLAVAAALVSALMLSMVPAHGFGPLLPVGRVLHEHARHHRHHDSGSTGPAKGSTGYRPGRTDTTVTVGGAPRHSYRPHGPRIPHRHRYWRHSHNALRNGLHRLGCKLLRRRC